MKSKISKIIIGLFVMIMMVNVSVFAVTDTNIIDYRADDKNYTASQASKIELPFVRFTAGKITLDGEIKKSGMSSAQGVVEVTGDLKGIHFFNSAEEVIIKGKVENAIVVSPKVTVEGEVTGLLITIGEKVEVREKAKVNEMYNASESLTMNGEIKENLLGSTYSLTLKGAVQNDLRMEVEKLNIDAGKVKGEVYFRTYNQDINAKYVYPSAKVDVLKKAEAPKTVYLDLLGNTLVAVASCIVIYYLFEELGKKKIITKCSNIVVNNFGFTILMSVVSLALILPVTVFSLVLAMIGFGNVAIAILALYTGIFIATIAMSLFITGSFTAKYITNKFVKTQSKITEFAILAASYALLYFVSQIGFAFAIMSTMFAFGTVITILFKKAE